MKIQETCLCNKKATRFWLGIINSNSFGEEKFHIFCCDGCFPFIKIAGSDLFDLNILQGPFLLNIVSTEINPQIAKDLITKAKTSVYDILSAMWNESYWYNTDISSNEWDKEVCKRLGTYISPREIEKVLIEIIREGTK